jgi:hypothetical protein
MSKNVVVGSTSSITQAQTTRCIGKIMDTPRKDTVTIGRIVEPPGLSHPSVAHVAPDSLYIWSQQFPAHAYSSEWFEYKEQGFHCWVCDKAVDSQHLQDATHQERIMSSSDNWSWNASMWVNYHKQKAEKQV